MSERSHYEEIGGKDTIAQAMRDMFRNRIPGDDTTTPPLSVVFGERLTDEALRDPHERAVGHYIGALFGGPGAETISVKRLADLHPKAFSGEVFDAVIGHAVDALTAAAEEAKKQSEMQAAIESILPAVGALRPLMVEPLPPIDDAPSA